jgi:hypothetical protein
MRLWSIHPKYLDTKGLLAVWREALLAKKVLQEGTEGYKKHPQLIRFKNNAYSINAINIYLNEIFTESKKRNFNFDGKKIGLLKKTNKINVSSEQVKFEFNHLLNKLKKRDIVKYKQLKYIKRIETHPLFKKIPGKLEDWEKK